MAYIVWVEIEEVEDVTGNHVAGGGVLGVLPDPLGSFDTLAEARRLQADVLLMFNPDEWTNSDAVDQQAGGA